MPARRYIIARDDNVVLVDFRHEPDPPAPTFPGAGALRTGQPRAQALDLGEKNRSLALAM